MLQPPIDGCRLFSSQDSYLEWIRAFFADDEGDTDDAEEDASHDHHHVHHEPCLGGVAIAAQLLGRWNLVKKYR